MSDEPVTDVTQSDPIQALRDEFAEQFATLKQSFESQISERDETITKLKEENDSLHRALVRSAMTTPVAPAPVKTEQDVYNDRIQGLAEKTLRLMRS